MTYVVTPPPQSYEKCFQNAVLYFEQAILFGLNWLCNFCSQNLYVCVGLL